MAELYSQQQALMHVLDKALDNFKKIGKNNYTPAKIRSRMNTLDHTWNQCIQLHALILHATPEKDRPTVDYFKRDLFEKSNEVVQMTRDYMAEYLEALEPKGPSQLVGRVATSEQGDASNSLSVAHLPAINLPNFSDRFEDWESYRDRFTALIIENRSLSAVARMHFLTSSLTGLSAILLLRRTTLSWRSEH